MNRPLVTGTFLVVSSAVFMALADAQQQTRTTPSLGELARQLKAERGKAGPAAAKLFTNDNLPTSQTEISMPTAPTATESGSAQTGTPAEGSSTAKSGAGQTHDEKYYRKAMADLRHHKEVHERELSVLQTKLNQNQMQYYPDPYKKAVQEYTRADINKLQQEIDKKKQEIAADDKAIDDLQEQLRREGGPPGWLR